MRQYNTIADIPQLPDNSCTFVNGVSTSIPYVPDLLSTHFSHTVINTNPETGDDVIALTSDIFLLFNQQRIQNDEGIVSALNTMVDRLYHAEPDKFKGFTDEQISEYVKSRYMQSPSEVKSWLTSLSYAGDAILESLAAKAAAANAAAAEAAAAAAPAAPAANAANVTPPKTD